MTDKEMVEMFLKNLGLEYGYDFGKDVIRIFLINDGDINRGKVCSHEEINFEFYNDGKFKCIAAY